MWEWVSAVEVGSHEFDDGFVVFADVAELYLRGLEAATGTAGEFERVDVIYFDGEGTLEIEEHIRWASRDRQPDAQWGSITFIALFFGLTDEKPIGLFGGEPLIHIVTVSTDGEYRYESTTDRDTLIA